VKGWGSDLNQDPNYERSLSKSYWLTRQIWLVIWTASTSGIQCISFCSRYLKWIIWVALGKVPVSGCSRVDTPSWVSYQPCSSFCSFTRSSWCPACSGHDPPCICQFTQREQEARGDVVPQLCFIRTSRGFLHLRRCSWVIDHVA